MGTFCCDFQSVVRSVCIATDKLRTAAKAIGTHPDEPVDSHQVTSTKSKDANVGTDFEPEYEAKDAVFVVKEKIQNEIDKGKAPLDVLKDYFPDFKHVFVTTSNKKELMEWLFDEDTTQSTPVVLENTSNFISGRNNECQLEKRTESVDSTEPNRVNAPTTSAQLNADHLSPKPSSSTSSMSLFSQVVAQITEKDEEAGTMAATASDEILLLAEKQALASQAAKSQASQESDDFLMAVPLPTSTVLPGSIHKNSAEKAAIGAAEEQVPTNSACLQLLKEVDEEETLQADTVETFPAGEVPDSLETESQQVAIVETPEFFPDVLPEEENQNDGLLATNSRAEGEMREGLSIDKNEELIPPLETEDSLANVNVDAMISVASQQSKSSGNTDFFANQPHNDTTEPSTRQERTSTDQAAQIAVQELNADLDDFFADEEAQENVSDARSEPRTSTQKVPVRASENAWLSTLPKESPIKATPSTQRVNAAIPRGLSSAALQSSMRAAAAATSGDNGAMSSVESLAPTVPPQQMLWQSSQPFDAPTDSVQRSGPAMIACTGFTRQTMAEIAPFLEQLAELSLALQAKKSTPTHLVTHMVICTQEAPYAKRTVKYFKALAKKLWIVRKEWVEHSANAGQLLPEVNYEVSGDTKAQDSEAPKKARGVTGERLNFVGLYFTVILPFNLPSISVDEIRELVEDFGGVWMQSEKDFYKHSQQANNVIKNRGIIIVDDSDCSEQKWDELQRKYADANVVTHEWLFSCICNQQFEQPPANFSGLGS